MTSAVKLSMKAADIFFDELERPAREAYEADEGVWRVREAEILANQKRVVDGQMSFEDYKCWYWAEYPDGFTRFHNYWQPENLQES